MVKDGQENKERQSEQPTILQAGNPVFQSSLANLISNLPGERVTFSTANRPGADQ
jgi:hypothetical protein